jgi:hypothetical protein
MADERSSAASGPSRRKLLRNGLLVGGVAVTGVASPLLTSVARADGTFQPNWAWCGNCQGLWWRNPSTQSVCPAGGTHISVGSGNYSLELNFSPVSSDPQQHWAWCGQCQGSFYGPYKGSSYCPAAGPGKSSTHITTGSGNYAMHVTQPSSLYQGGWAWCSKCMGMWYTQGPNSNVCPKDRGVHSSAGSGPYFIYDSNL